MGQYFLEERDGWIRDAVAKATTKWPGVTQKPMMGCACFWVEGVMFATIANGCVVLTKLNSLERSKVGGEPFFTGAGRPPIQKWVQVRVGEPAEVEALVPLLQLCYDRARSEKEG